MRLTVVNQQNNVKIENGNIFKIYEPKDIRFYNTPSTNITEKIALIYPLAYMQAHKWDKALNILDKIDSRESYLYKGICYYHKSFIQNASENLNLAIKEFDKVINMPIRSNSDIDSILMLSHLNRANVYLKEIYIMRYEAAKWLIDEYEKKDPSFREFKKTYEKI